LKNAIVAVSLILLAPAYAEGLQEAAWITAHTDRNPTVSPDGKQVLFQSDRSGRGALYVRSVEGGEVKVFLDSGDEPTYPDWSPDGKKVVFAAEVDGGDEIFVINVDGTGRKRLTDHPAREGHPRWSPDGKRIYFNSERVADEPSDAPEGEDLVDIFSVAADGSDLKRHTRCRSECSYPSVSPDGKRLLYRRVFWTTDADGKPVRNSEVVVSKLDGSNEKNLTNDAVYDVYPIWSHDGRHVYFSSVRPASEGRMHLWRLPAKGGAAEQLTHGEWSHRQAAPDRIGEKLYMFTFKRIGGVDVGYIGAVNAPAD
jgi:Tol biopolymer transport system component